MQLLNMCVVFGLGPWDITHVYSSESSISLQERALTHVEAQSSFAKLPDPDEFFESLVLVPKSSAHVWDSNGIFTLSRTFPLLVSEWSRIGLSSSLKAPTRARPRPFESGLSQEVLILFGGVENGFPKTKGDNALASRIEVGLLKASVPEERHLLVKSLNFGDPNREGIVLA